MVENLKPKFAVLFISIWRRVEIQNRDNLSKNDWEAAFQSVSDQTLVFINVVFLIKVDRAYKRVCTYIRWIT